MAHWASRRLATQAVVRTVCWLKGMDKVGMNDGKGVSGRTGGYAGAWTVERVRIGGGACEWAGGDARKEAAMASRCLTGCPAPASHHPFHPRRHFADTLLAVVLSCGRVEVVDGTGC